MAGAAVIRGLEAQASTALIYSLGLGLDCFQAQAQSVVQDAVASPPRRVRARVRKQALHGRGRRRRSSSRHNPGSEDDFFEGNGGNGGSENGNNGGGGSRDWWGENWSDEEGLWRWWHDRELRRAIFSFCHQLACWVCLLQSLHFLVKSVTRMSQGHAPYDYGETTAVLSH